MSSLTNRLHAAWLRQNASDRSFHWLVAPRRTPADKPRLRAGVSGAAAPDVRPKSRKVPGVPAPACPARPLALPVLASAPALALHGAGSGAGVPRAGAAAALAQGSPTRPEKPAPCGLKKFDPFMQNLHHSESIK